MGKTLLPSTAPILPEAPLSSAPILPEEQLPSTAPILPEAPLSSEKEPILPEEQLPSTAPQYGVIDTPDKLLWSLLPYKIQEPSYFEKIRAYAFHSIAINREEIDDDAPSIFTPITLKKYCNHLIDSKYPTNSDSMAKAYLDVLNMIGPINYGRKSRVNLGLSVFKRCVGYGKPLSESNNKLRTIIDKIAGENWDRIGILHYEILDIQRELWHINRWIKLGLTNEEINNRRERDYVIIHPAQKDRTETLLSLKREELEKLREEKMYLYS